MHRRVRLILVAAVAAGAALAAPGARADHEETELRLKSAGVDDDLRARIHAAIARGAKHLLRRQAPSGAFVDPRSPTGGFASDNYGHSALAGLALAHSGGPAADAGARGVIELIAPTEDSVRASATRYVYTAGITAMLLHAARERPAVCRKIVSNLVAELDPSTGWWGYGPGDVLGFGRQDFVNLSTSQYGALGLWAGSRSSGVVPAAAWRLHLRALCAFQSEQGSWSYAPSPARPYPNGTFMGIANLVLARNALADELTDDLRVCAASEVALRRARRALDRDVRTSLEAKYIDYYGWYAIEKACTFLDLEVAGGVRWYVAGALRLLEAQNDDGSWGGGTMSIGGTGLPSTVRDGDIVSTSFALLFLLRASTTFHPITPRRTDAPGATTPSSVVVEDRRARGPAAEPPPAPVAWSRAVAAVDAIEAWSRRVRGGADDVVPAIDEAGRALRRLEADPAPAGLTPDAALARETEFLAATTAWRARAAAALVAVIAARDDEPAVRAARALARGPRSASPALRRAIDHRWVAGGVSGVPRELIETGLAAVAALGDDDSLPWLAARVTANRSPNEVRGTRAALGALAAFDGGAPATRLAAAARVARALADLERGADAADPEDPASWIDDVHWRAIGARAITALESLCRDVETGAAAIGPDGAPPTNVAEFGVWIDAARRRR